ncbi:MAG: DMT family transporter [Kiloniellales bacterium]|nr:DMT family transporter [Kiloniellales bacterium]
MQRAETPDRRRNRPLFGIGLALASLALLSILTAMVKWLGEAYPVSQILFFRFLFALPPILYFLRRAGGVAALRTRRPLDHALRSGFGVCGIGLFFFAITEIPLAEATAIFYAAPIFVTALSVPILGEAVGPRRWTAVLVGFVGVFVITDPTGAVLGLGIMAAVASAVFSALVSIWIRRLSRSEATATIALYYNSTGTLVAGALVLIFGWRTPEPLDLLVLVSLGLIGGLAQYLMTASFRYAEASLLTPFEYLALIFAAVIGFLVWQEVPPWTTLTGAAIIVASGLFVIYREAWLAARGRKAASTAGAPDVADDKASRSC